MKSKRLGFNWFMTWYLKLFMFILMIYQISVKINALDALDALLI